MQSLLTAAVRSGCAQQGVLAPITCQPLMVRGDGPTLQGTLLAPEGFDPAICMVALYLGGCGAPAAASAAPMATGYLAQGAATCVVDYRGFGQSDGEPDPAGLYADAERMLAHLTGPLSIPPAHIVLHGYAQGASVAAELAARRTERRQAPLGGLVLDRPMASALSPMACDQNAGLGWLSGLLEDDEGASHITHKLRRISPTWFTVLITGAPDGLGVSGEQVLGTLLSRGFEVQRTTLEADPQGHGYDVVACCRGSMERLRGHVLTAPR
jgi:pimeloyl-ACP methyl ester carboxylesterase